MNPSKIKVLVKQKLCEFYLTHRHTVVSNVICVFVAIKKTKVKSETWQAWKVAHLNSLKFRKRNLFQRTKLSNENPLPPLITPQPQKHHSLRKLMNSEWLSNKRNRFEGSNAMAAAMWRVILSIKTKAFETMVIMVILKWLVQCFLSIFSTLISWLKLSITENTH